MQANNNAPVVPIRRRDRWVHLYMPLITAAVILKNRQLMSKMADPSNRPQDAMLFTAFSAIPTYIVGSYMYPPNLPLASPEESVRFTRKHDAYRAIVLFTYGRLFGHAFNPQFLVADFVLSYMAGYIVGERPAGTKQRHSEFVATLPWLMISLTGMFMAPLSMPTLSFMLIAIDRIMWRTAYLALVDDVIGVLSRPNVRTLRGKVTLVLAQAFTITSLVWIILTWLRRWKEGQLLSSKAI